MNDWFMMLVNLWMSVPLAVLLLILCVVGAILLCMGSSDDRPS